MAITYYAGNNWAGTSTDRGNVNTSNIVAGLTFLETNTDDLYQWDGDSWNVISGDTIAQTFANKTLTLPKINDTSANHVYNITVSELAADRNATLPLLAANDVFTFNDHAATFQNKTIVHGADGNSVTGIVNASVANSAAIANSKLAGPSIAVTDGSTSSNIAPGGTLTFTATANETTVAQSGGTVTIGMPNDVTVGGVLTVTGNLVVNGTTTTQNSTTVTVDDPIFTVGGDSAPSSDDNKDRGIEFRWHNGSAAKVGFFGFDDSTGKFTFIPDATNSSEVMSGTAGTIVATTFEGAVTGDITGDVTGNVSGNAGTVTNGVYTVGNQTIGGTKTFSATITGSIDGNAATVTNGVYLASTQTLTSKTLTSPAIGTNILDTNGNELMVLTATGSAVNEITLANGATGADASITASGETNTGIKISGKGTSGVTISNATANGAFLAFDTKAAPADPSAETAILYLKEIDSNNNAIAVKIQKAGAIQEVQITSPKAVCGECGSKDGASDPTYDFSRNVMILDLWCGHSYEVPMPWSAVNGNS